MGAQLGGKGTMSEMNLTPLIDIVLVVLIIMMVNIPIQVEEMTVKLPGAEVKTSRFDVPPEQLVIAVYEDERLALNRQVMTEDVLFYEVTRRLRPMDKKSVFIDAAPHTGYGRVVDMMDLARAAGASKVGLARMKEGGPLAPTSVSPGAMPRGVQLGNPNPVGFMTGRTAEKAMLPHMPAIKACYETALGTNPILSGRLTGRVDVMPDGSVSDFGTSASNLDAPELEQCVSDVLGTLAFEPLGEDHTARVLYPLLFSPG